MLATTLLWAGVLIYSSRPNPFNILSDFFQVTLFFLGLLTLAIWYPLRNQLHSWLTATLLAGIIVALAQWGHVI